MGYTDDVIKNDARKSCYHPKCDRKVTNRQVTVGAQFPVPVKSSFGLRPKKRWHAAVPEASPSLLSDACQPEVRSFCILKHLDAPKLVVLSVFTIIELICLKFWQNHRPKMENDLKNVFAKAHYYVTRLHN